MIIKGYGDIQAINEAKRLKSLEEVAEAQGFQVVTEGSVMVLKSDDKSVLPGRIVKPSSDSNKWICTFNSPQKIYSLNSYDIKVLVGSIKKAWNLLQDLENNEIHAVVPSGNNPEDVSSSSKLDELQSRLRQFEMSGEDYDDAEPWEMTWNNSRKADPFGLSVNYSAEKGAMTVAVRFFSDISDSKMSSWIDKFIKNNGIDKFKVRTRWDYSDADADEEEDGAGSGKGQVYCFINVTS